MSNEHTYAKIIKDDSTNYYKIIITKTDNDGIIRNHKEQVQEIPFLFRDLELAKDFISVLPDSIEKVNVKTYKCKHCHLCSSTYETYKLTIGNYEVFIKWTGTQGQHKGLIGDRYKRYSAQYKVELFVTNLEPLFGNWGNVSYDKANEKLSELIKELKEAEPNKEEYIFELVQQ